MRRWISLLVVCGACSRAAPAPEASRAAKPAPTPSAQPAAQADAAPAAPPPSAVAGARPVPAPSTKQLSQTPLQKRGCARVETVPLSLSAYQVLVPTQDTTLEALIVRDDRQTLEWWSGKIGGAPAAGASRKLSTRVAKLSLLRKASEVYALGVVDEQGTVWSLGYAAGQWSEPKLIAKGADRRFAPALYEDGAISLLAYTATVSDVMHTFVVRSAAPPGVDATPQGHGAAAPTFVQGVKEPRLVFLDARAGVSPLLEVGFDAALAPLAAEVRTPVSQPYAPPLLRAFAVPEGEAEVAFSAVGKLAATAIGRVPLRRALPAVALHPSRGYGEVGFDVALSGRAAVFALEVPQNEQPSAAHVIEVHWLDKAGDGNTLLLTPPAAGASANAASALRPSIAATPLPGELLVGYVQGTQAQLVRLRCDA